MNACLHAELQKGDCGGLAMALRGKVPHNIRMVSPMTLVAWLSAAPTGRLPAHAVCQLLMPSAKHELAGLRLAANEPGQKQVCSAMRECLCCICHVGGLWQSPPYYILLTMP